MPRRFASLALIAALAATPLAAQEATEVDTGFDPEMYGDMADAQAQNVEWVIRNNPALLDGVINEALRRNPGVVKEIIRDTLLRNPDIIIASLQEFQRQQQAQGAGAGQENAEVLAPELVSQLSAGADAPVRGNPGGTITLVEFSDYNCPHCRAFSRTLGTLIEKNPSLRVIHREWPIMGQDSVDVAKIALAAQAQGKYSELHEALMSELDHIDSAKAYEIAAEVGLDVALLKEAAEDPRYWAHIQKTAGFAQQMDLKGTPGIVIGDELARGAISVDQAQPIIDAMKVK